MTTNTLDPDVEKYVAGLVTSGRFDSRADVLSKGTGLIAVFTEKLARFDKEMQGKRASSEAEEGLGVHEAFDEMRRYLDTLLKKKAA